MREKIEKLLTKPESFKNNSIKNIWRLFSEIELEGIPEEKIDEEADATTYIEFSNNMIIGIYPNTEKFTLDYDYLELCQIPKEAILLSNNLYWSKRIGKKILNIKGIFGDLIHPQGIIFELEDSEKVELLYISESSYTFDALIIR